MAKYSSPFKANPGFIIAKPYIETDQTFVSDKENPGFSQKSEVLEVGGSFIDDHGNLRKPSCDKGDIIVHEYAQNEYEVGFEKYRAIKFYQVIGILKE